MYKTGSHSSLLAYKKCSAIRRSHNTSLSTDRPDSSSDDRISYCPYIHNNRFYSIRSKHKGKYLLILLQDALERIFTVFKKFNNSRFRIAILSNFAFLLHSEMPVQGGTGNQEATGQSQFKMTALWQQSEPNSGPRPRKAS